MSSPAGRTCFPGDVPRSTTTSPSRRSVSSHGTTASAPGGNGAPVMIVAAVPCAISTCGSLPAGRSSMSRSAAPGVASTARTAYPSIAELSKPGTAKAATTGSASTSPSARSTGMASGSSGENADRICCRASVYGMRGRSSSSLVTARLLTAGFLLHNRDGFLEPNTAARQQAEDVA